MKSKYVSHSWKRETLEAKIKEALLLPLSKRYTEGLAKGFLARYLERNQKRIYGRGAFKSIQVIKQK